MGCCGASVFGEEGAGMAMMSSPSGAIPALDWALG